MRSAVCRKGQPLALSCSPSCTSHVLHCRERKAIDLENLARYTALKARWKTLDTAVASDYVPSHDVFYLKEEEEEETDGSQHAEAETDKGKAEDGTLLKMLDITAKVLRADRVFVTASN